MDDKLKNIITFGAHHRIKNKEKHYDSVRHELASLYDEMESRKPEINGLLIKVVEVKKQGLESIQKIKKITKNIKGKDRDFIQLHIENEKLDFDLALFGQTINTTDVLLNSSVGAGAGIIAGNLTAGAVPFLVGQLATASTGTAISSLSGVAATNATLAWLGGGSIASGGGGMVAGTAVLGSLTLGIGIISGAAISTVFNHLSANKEIKKIKQAELEALKMIDQIRKNIFAFDLIEKRVNELVLSINKTIGVFEAELEKSYKKIFKIPILTKFVKQIKKMLGFRYYTDNDIKEISSLGKIAVDFAKLLDTKIIDEHEVRNEKS